MVEEIGLLIVLATLMFSSGIVLKDAKNAMVEESIRMSTMTPEEFRNYRIFMCSLSFGRHSSLSLACPDLISR